MRHIIIGDVHGCLAELEQLISVLRPRQEDRLYFIGDLIDRGPDSVGVVQYVGRLAQSHRTVLIIGNHEEKFLRYCHHKNIDSNSTVTMVGTEAFESYLSSFRSEDLTFLSASYINYCISGEDICLLHGGIPENIDIDLRTPHLYTPNAFKELRGADLILKTRYLDEQGFFLGLHEEKDTSTFWAERYEGRFGRVLFGHHAIITRSPVVFKYAVNLDTGCVFGGWLSACILEDGKLRFTGVPAKKAYCKIS